MQYRNQAAWLEIQQKTLEIRRHRNQQETAVRERVGVFDLAFYWLALTLAVCMLVLLH